MFVSELYPLNLVSLMFKLQLQHTVFLVLFALAFANFYRQAGKHFSFVVLYISSIFSFVVLV